jgi:hypothetical protein
MSTPTDQTRRNRHPEEFARSNDRNAKNLGKWTGIGKPATEYGWERNPVHASTETVSRPAGRATEELTRPPEITEYVPPLQPQRDAWSLTKPRLVEGGERKSLKPTAPDPVSKHPIVEYQPDPQKVRDPWSYGKPIVVESKPGITAVAVPKTER